MNYRGLFLATLLAVTPFALSAEPKPSPTEEARRLLAAGNEAEAFLKYLSMHGCEHSAIAVAKARPAEFLAVLKDKGKDLCRPRAKLVEGDLLLGVGKKDEALACYRAVAAAVGANDADGWDRGVAPRDWYYVEPPVRQEEDYGFGRSPGECCLPMTHGPGSHRDNWLVRRFIALESWDDAARELARVWEIHRRAAKPHVIRREVTRDAKPFARWVLIEPAGFSGKGLQFALDYAFFLKTRKDWPKAAEVLLAPLAVMDMHRNGDMENAVRVVSDEEAAKLPRLSGENRPGWNYNYFRGFSPGVSRKEFIRLAYGLFKATGKESDFIATIQGQIDRGENRARLVLARVLTMTGKADEAIALELAYIDQEKPGAYPMACCRGMIYDRYGRPAEAILEYEKAMALPAAPLPAIDADEDALDRGYASAAPMFLSGGRSSWRLVEAEAEAAAPPSTRPHGIAYGVLPGPDRPGFDINLLHSLQRLYAAAGRADRVLELSLLEMEKIPSLATEFQNVEGLQARFKAAGKEGSFNAWAEARLAKAEDLPTRMNLLWLTGRQKEAIEELIKAVLDKKPTQSIEDQSDWVQRIEQTDKAAWKRMGMAIAKMHPEDVCRRLSLLNEEGVTEGEALVKALEDHLDANAGANSSNHGANTECVDHPFVVAYRLMRLYEKAHQIDKLIAMGLDVARGRKNLAYVPESQWDYREKNGEPEYASACLALLIQHAADAKTEAAVEKAIKDCPWPGARDQLARRRAGGIERPANLTSFGWANLPKGVMAIAGSENVLSLARDESRIFAGHPWGVAVYDFDGKAVTRVALANAALHMVICNGALWVGTPDGVYRIDLKTYAISHLPCDQDVPSRNRNQDGRTVGVFGLAACGDKLWIGTARTVCILDTAGGEMRIFSPEEMGVDSSPDWRRFEFDGRFVWVGGDIGTLRYDAKAAQGAQWKPVKQGPDFRGRVELIGLIDGVLWGSVYMNDKLRYRPCIIDRERLTISTILIDDPGSRKEHCLNSLIRCVGRWGAKDGPLVFGTMGAQFIYEPGPGGRPGKLRPMPSDWDPDKNPLVPLGSSVGFGQPQRAADGMTTFIDDWTHRHVIGGLPFHSGAWSILTLPDGTRVVGGSDDRAPRYIYPREDWPFDAMVYEMPNGCGGLWLISPKGNVRQVSRQIRDDSILSDVVFQVVPEDAGGRTWLCGRYGVAVLDRDNRVVANLTRQDGLLANRVTSGAAVEGKVYFSARCNDHMGGLIVFDPKTAVFTSLTDSDGLASNSLEKIEAKGDTLKLSYGWEYMRSGNGGYQMFPDGQFTPATRQFSARGNPADHRDPRGSFRPKEITPMPILGGYVIGTLNHGGKEFIYGTRGLVIGEAGAGADLAKLDVPALAVKVRVDPDVALREAAVEFQRPRNETPAQIADLLHNDNPYIVANVLAHLLRPTNKGQTDYTADITRCVSHPNLRVRATAVALLSWSKDKAASEGLRIALKDSDPYIRAVAAIALAKRGEFPGLPCFEEILTRTESSYRNFPFGAESSLGFLVQTEKAYEALAPHADQAAFEFMLKRPLYMDDRYFDQARADVFSQLGQSLRRHPEAAQVLLQAHGKTEGITGPSYYPIPFAQHVLAAAGKEFLPVLHKALASSDRVVRSNAACACGEIGDPSSIDPLIRALDLESGLSRASIVWALGELKAARAAGDLAALYLDALHDEKRRRGSGYRMSQASSAIQSEYETIGNLDSIASDWNELKASTQPAPIDPISEETLLEPEQILDALRKIGPAGQQGWYRGLAAATDPASRLEAAQRLADGTQPDAEKNVPILRNLGNDADKQVRIAAAVSLLILNQPDTQSAVLEWLKSDRDVTFTMQQLRRVADKKKLAFCRDELVKLASDKNPNDYLRQAARSILGDDDTPASRRPGRPCRATARGRPPPWPWPSQASA